MKKQILLVMFAMCVVCVCGCSKKVVKESPFITSEHITEELISVPYNVDIGFDVMKDKDAGYLFLGKEENGLDSLWRVDRNNKWEVAGSLPSEFSESMVQEASILDEKNYFYTIAYDFYKEGSEFDSRQYLATVTDESKMQLIELNEIIGNPIKMDSKIFGIGEGWKIKSFDSKTGELLKTYDQSTFPAETFFVMDDKIVAAGGGDVETYDIKTAQICETKDSLRNFLLTNMWERSATCSFYDNDSEIVYCSSSEGIFSYDMNSEKEYQPIQNEKCTPYTKPLPINNLKICENVLFLSILEDPFSPRGPQVYAYTAD